MDGVGTDLSDLLAALATLNAAARRHSLNEVAPLVQLSPDRAQRVFTRLVGESPGRYQHRVALDRAAGQLTSSDEPIVDIAFANGFGSHEAFTRAFRVRFGVSPREYRNGLSAPWSMGDRIRATETSPCIGLYRQPLTNPPSHQ